MSRSVLSIHSSACAILFAHWFTDLVCTIDFHGVPPIKLQNSFRSKKQRLFWDRTLELENPILAQKKFSKSDSRRHGYACSRNLWDVHFPVFGSKLRQHCFTKRNSFFILSRSILRQLPSLFDFVSRNECQREVFLSI